MSGSAAHSLFSLYILGIYNVGYLSGLFGTLGTLKYGLQGKVGCQAGQASQLALSVTGLALASGAGCLAEFDNVLEVVEFGNDTVKVFEVHAHAVDAVQNVQNQTHDSRAAKLGVGRGKLGLKLILALVESGTVPMRTAGLPVDPLGDEALKCGLVEFNAGRVLWLVLGTLLATYVLVVGHALDLQIVSAGWITMSVATYLEVALPKNRADEGNVHHLLVSGALMEDSQVSAARS